MTPHGSKLTEWIRVAANRYLSDQTRKRIKSWLELIRSFPLRLLGIQTQLDQMREELERTKAKLNHLDGKLRYLQDGSALPQLGEPRNGTPSSHT